MHKSGWKCYQSPRGRHWRYSGPGQWREQGLDAISKGIKHVWLLLNWCKSWGRVNYLGFHSNAGCAFVWGDRKWVKWGRLKLGTHTLIFPIWVFQPYREFGRAQWSISYNHFTSAFERHDWSDISPRRRHNWAVNMHSKNGQIR